MAASAWPKFLSWISWETVRKTLEGDSSCPLK